MLVNFNKKNANKPHIQSFVSLFFKSMSYINLSISSKLKFSIPVLTIKTKFVFGIILSWYFLKDSLSNLLTWFRVVALPIFFETTSPILGSMFFVRAKYKIIYFDGQELPFLKTKLKSEFRFNLWIFLSIFFSKIKIKEMN